MSAAQIQTVTAFSSVEDAAERLQAFDWNRVGQDLDAQGNAVLERLISPDECQALAAMYAEDSLFRSRVVMGRHGFVRGEYKYFNYPLPGLITGLRTAVSPH